MSGNILQQLSQRLPAGDIAEEYGTQDFDNIEARFNLGCPYFYLYGTCRFCCLHEQHHLQAGHSAFQLLSVIHVEEIGAQVLFVNRFVRFIFPPN